ncbi:MAG: SDR family NAD(P)-dependent oxidoreductase [Hyphomonadaceae bacterium]
MDIASLFSVRGRRAFVTGGSSGIGLMIAEGLLEAGAEVWICGRKAAPLREAEAMLARLGPCRAVEADLATAEGVAKAAGAIAAAQDSLDILINNAGAAWGAPIDAFPRAGFEKVLDTNLIGPFELSQKMLPLLRRAASAEHPARIINIASIDGMRPPARPSFSYSASKAGLIMLTRHMAKYLAGDHIAVNAIAPGVFESKMTRFMFNPADPAHEPAPISPLTGRTGSPEDIVGAVLYLASRAGAHVTGAVIPVAGGDATIDERSAGA